MYPAIVELSLRVLMTYRNTEGNRSDLTGTEEALCEAAAGTLKDYITGVGRFAMQAPPPPMTPLEAQQQQFANMLGMFRS